MKKISKAALVALMLTTSAFALAGCNKVTAISVEKDNMPQLVFVQGQDIDLSKGKLTVKDKKGEKEIPMNASGVSVTGYDKNTLGEQEIVVKYEGQKTTLKVNVVARFVASSYEKDYFVGEEFNAAKGKITVTNNDGTSFTVPMSDAAITVGDLDSDAPATSVAVPVTYKKDAVEYSGSIPANVYAVSEEKSSFSKPRDVVYQSHETDIVLDGCYITLKTADESLERRVVVTEDMISGFDLSLVTEANKTTPLVQTLTATYAGVEYEFDVNIYYSGVTEFQKIAATLTALDWSGETAPTITKEQGESAVSAMKTYFGLVGSEKSAITEEEKLAVVRVATQYGYGVWADAAKVYEDTFTIGATGNMSIISESYATTKTTYESLQDETDGMYVYGGVLSDITNEFADEILVGETKIGEHLAGVFNPENFEEILPVFEYMLTMHEKLQSVTTWTEETLATHEAAINAAKDYIKANYHKAAGIRGVYDVVSKWRANDDYFEILYTYYYNTENTDAINALKDKYLPGELETIYSNIQQMIEYLSYYKSYVVQITDFVMLFEDTVDTANELIAAGGMYKDLYYSLEFSGFLQSGGTSIDTTFGDVLSFLRRQGLLKYWEGALDNKVVMTLWGGYLGILLNEDEGYAESDQYKTDVEKMFNYFVSMSPVDQYAFLCSSNNYYGYYAEKEDGTKEGIFVFDFAKANYNFYFGNLIYNYYAGEENGVLSEAGKAIFLDFMMAVEYYARKDFDSTTDCAAMFAEKMAAVKAAYELLSTDDKANFDEYLEDAYKQMIKLYETYGDVENLPETALGDWADDFKALEDACAEMSLAQQIIGQGAEDMLPYIIVIASYDRVKSIEKNILENAPENVLAAYYHEAYQYEKFNPELGWPISKMVYYFGTIYDYYRVELAVGDQVLYDWYTSETLPTYMVEVSKLLYTAFANQISTAEAQIPYVKAEVLSVMSLYRNLSAADKFLFKILDGNMDLYSTGVKAFLTAEFAENTTALAAGRLLVAAEQAYVQYAYLTALKAEGGTIKDETLNEAKSEFKTAYEAFLVEYGKLEGAEETAFEDVLLEMYQYYQNAYNGLTA